MTRVGGARLADAARSGVGRWGRRGGGGVGRWREVVLGPLMAVWQVQSMSVHALRTARCRRNCGMSPRWLRAHTCRAGGRVVPPRPSEALTRHGCTDATFQPGWRGFTAGGAGAAGGADVHWGQMQHAGGSGRRSRSWYGSLRRRALQQYVVPGSD